MYPRALRRDFNLVTVTLVYRIGFPDEDAKCFVALASSNGTSLSTHLDGDQKLTTAVNKSERSAIHVLGVGLLPLRSNGYGTAFFPM